MKNIVTSICIMLLFAACSSKSNTNQQQVESPVMSCSPAVEPNFVSITSSKENQLSLQRDSNDLVIAENFAER